MPSGSCLCGEVAYEYTVEPFVSAICHCRDCQKWSGSGSLPTIGIQTSDFKITKGSPKAFVSKGGSGKDQQRFFCPNCGSSLFAQGEASPGLTFVKTGSLDNDASDIHVEIELFTKDRRNFSTPVPGAKQMERAI